MPDTAGQVSLSRRIDIPADPPDITIVTTVLARYPARLLTMSMGTGCHSAAAAVKPGLPLVTRDRRATETYRALDVELDILP